ncbi:MAG: hypothetical protein U0872_07785 [Planctomycetaceae bacterium]
MRRLPPTVYSAGGLIATSAAAVQISQLISGQAAPDLWNYAVTAATGAAGLGFSLVGLWPRKTTVPADSPDDQALVTALDDLFVHFADDAAAQESVRVVARALIERRYRQQIVS